MKLDVLSAMHLLEEPLRLVTSTAIKNFIMTCDFSTDHVSSNDDSAVKLNEVEEDDWYSLQPRMQSADYPTHDSALEVRRINKVLDQHLTRPEEELEEGEEITNHNTTLLDATTKYEGKSKSLCPYFFQPKY
jgi:hypothetical protein